MQLHQLKRREFITLIGGAAVAWPLPARAQQAGKVPTIGLLGAAAATAWSPFVANFVRRLGELGWVEGRTVAIEYRWADARKERFAEKGEKQWQSTSCLRASLTKESARSVIHQNGQTPSKKWRRSAERP
jgi:putative ABC transport system substrate-binding protein